MPVWVAVVFVAFLLTASVLAVLILRRPKPIPPPPLVSGTEEDTVADRARRQELDRHGTELLDRRVELDARRGALGGDTAVYDAFVELEQRLRAGDISEQEFEAEKLRLLGG